MKYKSLFVISFILIYYKIQSVIYTKPDFHLRKLNFSTRFLALIYQLVANFPLFKNFFACARGNSLCKHHSRIIIRHRLRSEGTQYIQTKFIENKKL